MALWEMALWEEQSELSKFRAPPSQLLRVRQEISASTVIHAQPEVVMATL
jgi:hypothetical protein